jgi:cobalt-zinc-cadmium efflux system outer membrane protein
MNTYQRIATATLATMLCAVPVYAQGALPKQPSASPYVDATAGLALDQAIARALEREPALRAARAEIDVARGLRRQAGLRPNPTLSFERRGEPAGSDNLTSVGVEWPLDLWRRQGRIGTAERQLTATEFAVADRARILAGDVRVQYGATAAAARDVQVADDLVAVAQRQLDLVRARVETGATPPLQADLLDVELRRLQAERIVAGGRAESELVRLKQLLGMPPEEPLLLRETLEGLVTSRDTDPTAQPSSPSRPDLREAEARVTIAEARIDQANRESRPEMSVFGTYMRMDSGFPQLGFNAVGALERVRGQFNYVAAGVTLTVPLLNRNQGQIAAVEAERSGALARQQAAELAARAEIAAAQARDVQARRALALYAGGIRTLARQNLDVVTQTFDLGRATVFDVLTEQRRYVDIELAYTAALREAWEARAALQRARGDMP